MQCTLLCTQGACILIRAKKSSAGRFFCPALHSIIYYSLYFLLPAHASALFFCSFFFILLSCVPVPSVPQTTGDSQRTVPMSRCLKSRQMPESGECHSIGAVRCMDCHVQKNTGIGCLCSRFLSCSQPPYKNPALSPEERANDGVGRLTLEEELY